jgi:hypothetical protein
MDVIACLHPAAALLARIYTECQRINYNRARCQGVIDRAQRILGALDADFRRQPPSAPVLGQVKTVES